jgi:hypothetical protein
MSVPSTSLPRTPAESERWRNSRPIRRLVSTLRAQSRDSQITGPSVPDCEPTATSADLQLSIMFNLSYIDNSHVILYDLRFSRRWLWRMVSSGMLRRVALVRTDISEKPSASIRVTRIGEIGKTLAATSNRRTLRRNTKVGARFLRNVGSYKSHTA